MPDNNDLELEPYRKLLQHPELQQDELALLGSLIERVELLSAENARLRKTILRLSAGKNGSRMSSKLRDALYE